MVVINRTETLLCLLLVDIFLHAHFFYDFTRERSDQANIFKDGESPKAKAFVKKRKDLINCLPKGGIIAEIGVASGVLSQEILDTNKPSEFFLVDCWESYAEFPEKVYPPMYTGVVQKFLYNENITIVRQFSHKAAAMFPDQFFDWVYIDANHTYEAARDDLHSWLPKVKTGGFIAGHDYFDHWYFGVKRAVNEFLAEYNYTLEYLTTDDFAPSYAIKIIR